VIVNLGPSMRKRIYILLILFLIGLTARVGLFLIEDTDLVTGKLSPVRQGPNDRDVVALTFDIPWGEQHPLDILDLLFRESVRATFFVSASWAATHADIVNRMLDEGHEIASRGDRQVNLSRYPLSYIEQDLTRARETTESVTGQALVYLRPATGEFSDDYLLTAISQGYQVVLWTVDSEDYLNQGTDKIVSRVLKGIKPGAIIRFSATDTTLYTLSSLEQAIPAIKDKGYGFVTLSELFSGN